MLLSSNACNIFIIVMFGDFQSYFSLYSNITACRQVICVVLCHLNQLPYKLFLSSRIDFRYLPSNNLLYTNLHQYTFTFQQDIDLHSVECYLMLAFMLTVLKETKH